jgi:uncharacterized protein (TIGR00369 family)
MLPDDEDRRRAPPPTPQSGYQQLMGYRLVEWREGLAIAELAVGPQHLNISGVLHGGVLMSLLDTVCGYAGCFNAEPGRSRRAITLSLTTSFTAPVTTGVVRAVGRVRFAGRRTFFCDAEVFDQNDTVVAIGQGTFQYRREPLGRD